MGRKSTQQELQGVRDEVEIIFETLRKTGRGPDWAKNQLNQFPNASSREIANWSIGSGDGKRGPIPPSIAAQAAAKETARIAAEKKLKEDNLTEGTANVNNAFASYDDDYYNGIAKKYLDYYLPQVDDQYKKSGEQLLYNLSRNGIFDSSAKTDAYANADKIYGEQKQDITSKANKFSSDARTYISDQKNALTGQLNLTGGDPLQASGFLGKSPAAISVTAPTAPNFSPLANLFDNITSIAKNETNAAMLSNQYGGGGYAGSFNKPLKSRGSSRFAD